MTFGKRTVPPKLPEPEDDNCPQCRGAGAIRGRGQRKVCPTCNGSGKRPPSTSAAPAACEEAGSPGADASEAAMLDT